jgi:hypothetical protein
MTDPADNEEFMREALPLALTVGSTTVVQSDVSNGDRAVARVIQTRSVLRPRP